VLCVRCSVSSGCQRWGSHSLLRALDGVAVKRRYVYRLCLSNCFFFAVQVGLKSNESFSNRWNIAKFFFSVSHNTYNVTITSGML